MQVKWPANQPTLGPLAVAWIEAHCKVTDGFMRGDPFVMSGWQLECAFNHYRVRSKAALGDGGFSGSQQFRFRRSLFVGPQKTGKSPMGSAIVTFEAVGPCLFSGWARGGELYRCEDHGCGCGFEWEYLPGEPMGMPRPTSFIQLLATAEDQTDNVYRPLQDMIRLGPLQEQMKVTDGFIRLPNAGRIDPITAAPNSKLGNPINFALADESGIYTGKLVKVWRTMRRGLAGMSGRSIEITNPWDPMDNSAAQQTYETHADDVFIYYRKPPGNLRFEVARDRRKILELVYDGSPWVDLDAVEAEIKEGMVQDPAEMKRFFGNMLVQGLGSYMQEDLWDDQTVSSVVADGVQICLGFDGSRSGDWTAIRAETLDGYRFTPRYGPDSRPSWWDPKDWPNGRIPRGEVDACVAELMDRFEVGRFYVDPRHWETQADHWASLYGEDVVVQWPTNSIRRMFEALVRFQEDLAEGLTTHSDDDVAKDHALRARKVAKPGDQFVLGKPADHMKIDILMADILAHEAAADMRALGWDNESSQMIFFG